MLYPQISRLIIELQKKDLKLRDSLVQTGEIFDGYHPKMEALHLQNAEELSKIIDQIGYPTNDKVGKEASDAAWLVIQHAISNPEFMKSCLKLLKEEVTKENADPKQLAYLSDRILVLEGKPQLYGTQFDWDDNGELSPNVYDDRIKVNNRRKEIGLNALEEQTTLIRKRALEENQTAPEDFEERKREMDLWRLRVGWIK
jgi:hypothetical protein